MSLTVAILALDETDRIGEAIRSASFADEVLVLDSGSSDGTAALARELGARVLETDWPGFVAQRNRALRESRGHRVFFLDADERISPTLARSLIKARGAGRVRRRNHWLGRPIAGGCFGPSWILRLAPREGAEWRGQGVHETFHSSAPAADLEGVLEHHPYRNLDEHLATIDRYATLFAEHDPRRARWWDVAFRPPLHFVKSYLLLAGFRDGVAGLVLAWLGASHVALKWGRLYLRPR